VLLLDPTYGEYAHVLEQVVGARVDRFGLRREDSYDVPVERLAEAARGGYDLVVVVNPNSPTGRHVGRDRLEAALSTVPEETLVWVDETYVDYVGAGQSLEAFAARSPNVVVCKSMSKAYALSGLRAAYLCGPRRLVEELRPWSPPWAVSLPAQVAAVRALHDPGYYAGRYAETHVLRERLADDLRALGLGVTPGTANFLLCHLPDGGPDAGSVVEHGRRDNVFLRDAGPMGTSLGSSALRVAVKDATGNRRIVDAVAVALSGAGAP
jgi:histidinol-phosphate/aromatic aminotransferase/cobyric acid decarboxylase-like protein